MAPLAGCRHIKRRTGVILFGFLLLGLGWFYPCRAVAQEVVVVLGSDSQPYQEALVGVKEAYGPDVKVVKLSQGDPHITKDTRVIVAIGGKAALYSYAAPQAELIYCLAPGVLADPKPHPAGMAKVYVSPPPDVLLRQLRALQPALKRLQAFWIDSSAVSYGKILIEDGDSMGVSVRSERLGSLNELPDRLRAIKGRVDALWLPPDPLLITPQSFAMVRQFSWDNEIPLYVSMDSLADQGAAASISVTFRDMGRKAGALAALALSGSSSPLKDAYFVDKVSVTINATSADRSGLKIPAEVSKAADRIVP